MALSFITDFIKKIDRAYAVSCQPVIDKYNISKISFDIIMFLYNNPGYSTAKEISTMRNIKPNVVSIHVEQLVNDGFLERRPIPEDRRKVQLALTEKAKPVMEEGRKFQNDFYLRLSDGLDKKDMEAFRHCFEVIASNADMMQ